MFPDRLSPAQNAALEAHYALLCRWNQKISLTTVTQRDEAIERHYAESLFLADHLPATEGLRIVDIGSGPGFPGFPVAVARPDCQVILVESNQRKAVFLQEASRGMANVRVLAKRAEEVGERFDWAISRAVSYVDLIEPLRKLAPEAALLTGGDSAPVELGIEYGMFPVPGGSRRFLRLFHVKQV